MAQWKTGNMLEAGTASGFLSLGQLTPFFPALFLFFLAQFFLFLQEKKKVQGQSQSFF
ncbi:MAG TPA: hypothetical protein VFF09_00175 [archaeon]|nr:hypothetical protein [archaeon]